MARGARALHSIAARLTGPRHCYAVPSRDADATRLLSSSSSAFGRLGGLGSCVDEVRNACGGPMSLLGSSGNLLIPNGSASPVSPRLSRGFAAGQDNARASRRPEGRSNKKELTPRNAARSKKNAAMAINHQLQGTVNAGYVSRIVDQRIGSFDAINVVTALKVLNEHQEQAIAALEFSMDDSSSNSNSTQKQQKRPWQQQQQKQRDLKAKAEKQKQQHPISGVPDKNAEFESVVNKLEAHLQRPSVLNDLTPRMVASASHSLAKMGRGSQATFNALGGRFVAVIRDCIPRDLSMVAWSFATRKAGASGRVLDAIADAVLSPDTNGSHQADIDSFNSQDISNLVWAHAERRHSSPELFDALEARAQQILRRFGPEELSMTLWGYASLDHKAPRLVEAARALVSGKTYQEGEIAMAAWSLAVFDEMDGHSLRQWTAKCDSPELLMDPGTLRALFQAALAAQQRGRGWKKNSERLPLPRSLLRAAKRSWLQSKHHHVTSELHAEVKDAVERHFGLPCEAEVLTEDGLFSVDLMVTVRGGVKPTDPRGVPQKVAIEVDGPHHFTTNPPFRPLGSKLLRDRFLAARVDRLVCVPHFEWYEVRGDKAREARFLEELLNEAGVALPAAHQQK